MKSVAVCLIPFIYSAAAVEELLCRGSQTESDLNPECLNHWNLCSQLWKLWKLMFFPQNKRSSGEVVLQLVVVSR